MALSRRAIIKGMAGALVAAPGLAGRPIAMAMARRRAGVDPVTWALARHFSARAPAASAATLSRRLGISRAAATALRAEMVLLGIMRPVAARIGRAKLAVARRDILPRAAAALLDAGKTSAMCNNYASAATADEMRRLFDVLIDDDHLGNAEPLASIFPNYDAPIVRIGTSGKRELRALPWGFRTTKKSKRTDAIIKPAAWNNARDDKLTIPLWRESFETRRCLVPATAYCEAKGRQPAIYHWYALARSRPPFAFAGMWRVSDYLTADGPERAETFTVITTSANALAAEIGHERMPVILPEAAYGTYLDGTARDAYLCLKPYPAEEMEVVAKGEGLTADPAVKPD